MVKQSTHNRSSGGSIPSGRTKYIPLKLTRWKRGAENAEGLDRYQRAGPRNSPLHTVYNRISGVQHFVRVAERLRRWIANPLQAGLTPAAYSKLYTSKTTAVGRSPKPCSEGSNPSWYAIYAAFSVVEAPESVTLVGTDRIRNVCPTSVICYRRM